MKKSIGWIVIGLLAVILFVKLRGKETITAAEYAAKNDDYSNNNNDAILAKIRKELKVKDAIITEANVLYVQVVDDGTKRDGYATYLCGILKENKSLVNRVKVVKLNSSKDPKRNSAYGILLGESACQ